jgi:flavin reductase (DIM6/NTAB) family NADH-FMN oxidoreductase RutF
MRFAGQIPGLIDRFAGIEYTTAATGAPILPGVNGWVDCRLTFAYDGGDHTIFVGDVVACAAQYEGDPLLYYHRHWRRLHDDLLQLPLA